MFFPTDIKQILSVAAARFHRLHGHPFHIFPIMFTGTLLTDFRLKLTAPAVIHDSV